jgi:hypothetical protein
LHLVESFATDKSSALFRRWEPGVHPNKDFTIPTKLRILGSSTKSERARVALEFSKNGVFSKSLLGFLEAVDRGVRARLNRRRHWFGGGARE